jgi:uncharacterized damage-inducible protein DinB
VANTEAKFFPAVLSLGRRSIQQVYFPRIKQCLEKLSEDDVWWRPNAASNCAGNLVLHLAGNVRQWIGSGLGGSPDVRNRNREFAESGPIPREELLRLLQREVRAACRVLTRLSAPDLERTYIVQGFRVTGVQIITHVVEHFAYHCGQIIYVTKLRLGTDLKFTRLPGDREGRPKGPRLAAL